MTRTIAVLGEGLVRAHAIAQLESAGFTLTQDPADAEVVVTYFPATTMLEDAYFGKEGLIRNCGKGTLFVDLSPTTPSFAREVSAVALVNDCAFVEAPIAVTDPLGSPEFSCFVASDSPESIADAREVLEAITSSVEETGQSGSAQLAKAAHTIRMTSVLVGAIEAEALLRSSHEGAFDEDELEGGIAVELMMADIAAAMMAADDVELILPQLEAAMHLFELLVVIGGADMNPAALSLLYREEEASAACGLDWTRAEGLYADHDHGHEHDHDFDDFYDEGDFGYMGGFGGYSAN